VTSFVTPVDGQPAVAESVAQITLNLDGTRSWPITIAGVVTHKNHVLFSADNTFDIGASGATRPRNLYVGTSARVGAGLYFDTWSMVASNTYRIGTNIADTLNLATNDVNRWTVSATGHLLASVDSTYDIGASGNNRPWNIYLGGSIAGSGNAVFGGALVAYGGATLHSHLTFGTDNTYDIGASGATRPRTVYAGTSVTANTVNTTYITSNDAGLGTLNLTATSANGYIDFSTNGGSRWRINPAGHLISMSDNTQDIGASAATRPRYVYAGTGVIVGGATGAGTLILPAGGTNTTPNFRFADSSNTGIYSPTSNEVGISTAGYERVRVAYSATSILNRVGLSSLSQTYAGVNIATADASTAVSYGVCLQPTFQSNVTSSAQAMGIFFNTAAAVYTLTAGYGIRVNPPILGSGNLITTMNGVRVDNQGKSGVTNAYGVHILAQSGAAATNVGLRNEGTTELAGTLAVNGASTFQIGGADKFKVEASGVVRANGGNDFIVSTGSPLATTATSGYFYMPISSGAPTGVPAAGAAWALAMTFDVVTGRMWLYYGAAWHYIQAT